MLQSAVIISTALCIIVVQSAPPIPHPLPIPETHLLQNSKNQFRPETETLSLEGLDYLLRRAEKLFRTPDFNDRILPEPYLRLNERLQPPNDEPYNFYLPVYSNDDYSETKNIDMKSKNLLKFSPPEKSYEHNYYAAKPKKIPKKYSSAVKHVNIKKSTNRPAKIKNEWEAIHNDDDFVNMDDLEDEEHKIIFDDSYFGVDSHIPIAEQVSQYNINGQDSQHSATSQKDDDDMEELEDGEKELPKIIKREQEMHHDFGDGPKSYKFGFDTGKG